MSQEKLQRKGEILLLVLFHSPSKCITSPDPPHFLRRDLCCLANLQEEDWQMLQADLENAGYQLGPHQPGRLNAPLLLKPRPAQAGANGGQLHRQEGRGA